jgi:CRP-like cAMP-binding protein
MPLTYKNTLLRAIEPRVLSQFRPSISRVELERGDLLQDLGREVAWVWFPECGLVSVTSETVDGESVSGASIGANGACGVFEACGSRQSFARVIVQIPGVAWRLKASVYRELFEASPGLRQAVHRYVESVLVEARQSAACNAIHAVERRLSRALLECADRSGTAPHLPLTQEVLANMLGVQRSTVAVAVSTLQKTGAIKSGRGALEIVDVAALERASCTCRRTIRFALSTIYESEVGVCDP